MLESIFKRIGLFIVVLKKFSLWIYSLLSTHRDFLINNWCWSYLKVFKFSMHLCCNFYIRYVFLLNIEQIKRSKHLSLTCVHNSLSA